MKNRILTICLLVAVSMGSMQAFGATAKAGQACPKVGIKSGVFICSKISGALKWAIVKKSQTIRYTAIVQASITEKYVLFAYSSTSTLAVSAVTASPLICTVGKTRIAIVGTPGICRLTLKQPGNAHYFPATSRVVQFNVFGTNIISFQLPGALSLSDGTYLITATSNAKLPVSLTSETPAICAVSDVLLELLRSGTCTIVASQGGVDLIPAAKEIVRSVVISADRVAADLLDTFSGFQIKPIYVVPSDATDNGYDINGYLAGILDEGNSYLNAQIGRTIPIDSTATSYDIQYLKSQYSTEYLRTHALYSPSESSDAQVLMREIKAMENPGDNRKDYIFFIDVPGFSNSFCGIADTPGISAVVALQNISATATCTGASPPYFDNYTAKTWLHELMHNFGVTHTVDDPCDLMAGLPETKGVCTSTDLYTMDKERTRYVGAAAQGPDVLKLRVWEGQTADQNLTADCSLNLVPRQDGTQYAYCPTGTQTIAALTSCWSSINSVSLEERINGAWSSLGAGSHSNQPWGTRLSWKCQSPGYSAPWKTIQVDTPGIRHYRWIVDGQVSEELNVIWVN